MPDTLHIARQFIGSLPHSAALGMRVQDIGPGYAVLDMPYDTRFVGDPATGVLHGGAVSALMDTASGASVISHPTGAIGTATIDLRIDYMRPATPGQTVIGRGECYHITRSVAFVRGIAHDGDPAKPIAHVAGTYFFTAS